MDHQAAVKRTSFATMTCSIARALEQVGDWWTLLLIREAFYGTRRFGDFERHLGIASNVLSGRLADLVAHGIFEVAETSVSGKALDYRLTDKGRDLFPVIVALAQWGDRHAAGRRGPPIRIIDRATMRDIQLVTVRAHDGQALQPRDLTVIEGPGASAADKLRFEEARRLGLLKSAQVKPPSKAKSGR